MRAVWNSIERDLQSILHSSEHIALHEPHFFGNEKKYLNECVDTNWVSSAGNFVDRFESELCKYTGINNCIAVVNGTAALHSALNIIGVDERHEILVPSMTFVATANAVKYCGATPHFVDVDEETLGINVEKLSAYLEDNTVLTDVGCVNKSSKKVIKAAMVVHLFGHPPDLDPLKNLLDAYRIDMVEDVAQSLGSLYKGMHVGGHGKISAISFNGNKIITSGGGGAILTNDEALAHKARHITTTARVTNNYEIEHDETGFNYRMPNINAALGLAQLENIHSYVKRKRDLHVRYKEALINNEFVSVFSEKHFARSNYWLNVMLLRKPNIELRDFILRKGREKQIEFRPAWKPIDCLTPYRNCPRMDLSVAHNLYQRIVELPSSSHLNIDAGHK